MSRSGASSYARAPLRRAVAAVLTLSLSASAFVASFALAVVQKRELCLLQSRDRGPAPVPQTPLEGPAEAVEPVPTRAATAAVPGDARALSRYRFATEVNTRIAAAGITVLRILPADARADGPSSQRYGFQYEIVGPPARLLELLRSLCAEGASYEIDALRLWVEGAELRAELTVR